MPETFAVPRIEAERRDDGTLILRSAEPLAEHPVSVVHSFRAGSEAHPDRLLVAERVEGEWARSTWGEARAQADRLAQGLLDRGLADRPVMVLSGNSRLHLVVVAGRHDGRRAAYVPTSVAYSLQSTDHAKLRAMAELVDPGLVVAEDASFAGAVAAVGGGADRAQPRRRGPGVRCTPTNWSRSRPARSTAGARRCAGTTSPRSSSRPGRPARPKGVHQHPRHAVGQPAADAPGLAVPRRRAARPARLAAVEPHLRRQPRHEPGAHQRRHALDRRRPSGAGPGRADRRATSPTPARRSTSTCRPATPRCCRSWSATRRRRGRSSTRLRLGFFAAAALPQQLWDRLQKLSAEHGGSMQMTTSWGLTETAPAATSAHFPITRSDSLGVPLPGVELALVPVGDKTEVRVRGANVTPGYHGRPDLTEAAFDEEGFFRTGDAVDARRPGRRRGRGCCSAAGSPRTSSSRPARSSASARCGRSCSRRRRGCSPTRSSAGRTATSVTALVWLHPDHAGRCDDDGVPGRRPARRAGRARCSGWPPRAAARPSAWSGCSSSASHPRWTPGRSPTRAT